MIDMILALPKRELKKMPKPLLYFLHVRWLRIDAQLQRIMWKQESVCLTLKHTDFRVHF